MRNEYKTPILVNVLRIYAGVSVLIGVVGGLVLFAENEMLAIISFVAGIGQAVICLGIGECVDFLGRTAHNTTILAQQCEREQHKQLQAARAPVGGYGKTPGE